VPAGYVPPNSAAHPVQSSESWISIAKDHKIADPWDLIDFNFPGVKELKKSQGLNEAAKVVNWYLENNVGCTDVTADCKNYKFKTGLQVYYPSQAKPAPNRSRLERAKQLAERMAKAAKNSHLQFVFRDGGLNVRQGGNYCGPKYGATKQDVESGKLKELPLPLDRIDGVCMVHDQCYEDTGYFNPVCDAEMIKSLLTLVHGDPNATMAEKLDAYVMSSYFAAQITQAAPALGTLEAFKFLFKPRFDKGQSPKQIIDSMPKQK
jgi:hypothetical protein